ncbi:pentapeptide repeat-containing protein, partial [Aliterella atlantica]|uniref:pentapeptide repeat-containing protein n=1 Tax=Aliterella atlantica TaxID=1827278 RepID=UPI00069903F8
MQPLKKVQSSSKKNPFVQRQISEYLIQAKAYEIWKNREQKGEVGSHEDDWHEALEWLRKGGWSVFRWKLSTGFRNIWGLHLWLVWNLPTLFADFNNRNFALDVVKTVISALGLLATAIAAVGLFITYINSQKEIGITEKRLITDRFSKAVELLGSKDDAARLGGIYSLEEIAREYSQDYHWRVMEVLTSYVRVKASYPIEIKNGFRELNEHSQWQCPLPNNGSFTTEKDCYKQVNEKLEGLPSVSEEIQVALTVIKRRNIQQDKNQKLDLSFSNLKRAYLAKANFQGADLTRTLLKRSDLSGADLTGAKLLFTDLVEARLENTTFLKADLRDADIQGANLQGANFQGANLQDAYLQRANLQGTDLQRANLQGTDLQEANLQGAKLDKAKYTDGNTKPATCKKYNLVDH